MEKNQGKLLSVPIASADIDNIENILKESIDKKNKNLYIHYRVEPKNIPIYAYGSDIVRYQPPTILAETIIDELEKEISGKTREELREDEVIFLKKRREITNKNFKALNNNKSREELQKEILKQVDEEKNIVQDYQKNLSSLEQEGIKKLGEEIALTHDTALEINHHDKKIRYQDSFGAKIPEDLKKLLQKVCIDYSISEERVKQQHSEDHCNCPIWTTLNLKAFIENKAIQPFNGNDKQYISFIESEKSKLIKELETLKFDKIDIEDDKFDIKK